MGATADALADDHLSGNYWPTRVLHQNCGWVFPTNVDPPSPVRPTPVAQREQPFAGRSRTHADCRSAVVRRFPARQALGVGPRTHPTDPLLPFELAGSRRKTEPRCQVQRIQEADVRGHRDSAIRGRSRRALNFGRDEASDDSSSAMSPDGSPVQLGRERPVGRLAGAVA